MRIAHVVTYVSPDGAFGGPVRVAQAQAEALAELGHEITVFAAAPSELARTSFQDGYELRTFAARRISRFGGFAAMCAPKMLGALKVSAPTFDVAHIHLARDLVTIPAALRLRRAGVPYVLQPHGMIDASGHPLAKPLDALATRPLLRGAGTVLTLTDEEASDVAAIEPSVRQSKISNGIRIGELAPYSERENTVLFLARLHRRKRPLAFIEMAVALATEAPDTRFILAGPDEGEGSAVLRAISEAGMGDRLTWIGAVAPDETEALLARARVFVLPAVDEVFPMTILESLRVGTPVVTTNSLGIAVKSASYGAAIVTDGSPDEMAHAVKGVLTNRTVAEKLRAGGANFLREQLNIETVARELESVYAATIEVAP